MAFALADRIKETTNTTGTGALTLAGAVTGFRTFATIGNGNTTYYGITSGLSDWEVGLGTYSSTGPTLTRTTVIASSNANAAINVASGAEVYVTNPASFILNPTLTTLSTSSVTNVTALGTASVVLAGGMSVEKSVLVGETLYVGSAALGVSLTSPTFLAKTGGSTYTQAAIINSTSSGSADLVTYGNNGTDAGGWADMGFTGSAFSDSSYTITGQNDGYVFVQAVSGAGLQGNLVLATGSQGTLNDLVFGTGGFLAANEKMRFVHSTGQFDIQTTTASSSTTTGALRVRGGAGIAGMLNVGGGTSTTAAISATYTPSSTAGAALLLTGKDSQGGTGYLDFLKVTNTASGATNINKYLRLNSVGNLEVVNSAYSATLFILSDAGAVTTASSISDNLGNVRAAPPNSQGGAYAIVASDAGKHINITTGGVTVNVSTLAAGDMVTIFNNSASSQTITSGTSVTMYLAGTATTGNRTLAQRGVATILCVTGGASAVYVISGAGLT